MAVQRERSSAVTRVMNDQTSFVPDIHTDEVHRISIPPSDVERCVSFSLFHSLVSIFALCLVLTDIPRTGLSMRLKDFFPSPRPGVVLYHGPLDYPVVHVVRENKGSNASTRFTGRIDDTSISQLSIRSHKFDMASVPWRAMAKHLHVDSVPACLLYQAPCLSPYLRLATVFAMLDDVYSKLQTRYFASKDKTMNALPVLFHTTAKWADRLHHVLGSFWWHREEKKLHIIHSSSLQ